jgi:hypothetical protein
MALAELYATELRTQLRRFATWEPGTPMELGDFGELRGSLFIRLGNVANAPLAVTMTVRKDQTDTNVTYSSANAVGIEFDGGASGQAGPEAHASVGLKISFNRANAIYFNLVGARYDSVSDQTDLERQLLDRFRSGVWDGRHVVVTERVGSRSATVIVSSASSAAIHLKAEGETANLDLADAKLKLGATSESNIGYRAITSQGMTPLMSLSRIRPRGPFWSRRTELVRELGFESDGSTAPPTDTLVAALEDQLGSESLRDTVLGEGVDLADGFSLMPIEV